MAHAQIGLQTGAKPTGPAAPDLAFTYNTFFTNAGPGQCGCFRMSGGSVQFGMPNTPHWSVVVDLAGETTGSVNQSATGLSLISYTVGERYSQTIGRTRIFTQALAGGARGFYSYFPNAANSSSATGFALLAGGGLDVHVSKSVALRVVQLDYLFTNLPNSTNDRQNNIRLGAGILFHMPSRQDVH
jgi:hypothetical protein